MAQIYGYKMQQKRRNIKSEQVTQQDNPANNNAIKVENSEPISID